MKKFISVLISLCLLETAVLGQGIVPSIPVAGAPEQISSKINSVLNYSKITSSNDAGSPFSVVIIQDLHCHPGVQKNISIILSQLYENYNVKNVFVEGACGDLNTLWLSLTADKNFADKAADILLSDGKLTGSEYFAYKIDNHNILKGIEDREIHLENLRRLASIVESKNEIELVLTDIEKELNRAQEENYGVFNKKLNRLHKQYKEGKINSEKYYKKLMYYFRIAQKKDGVFKNVKINTDEYREIAEYLTINSQRNGINIKSVSSQITSALNELKNTITYNRYNRLIQKTDSFKDTNVLFEELAAFDKEKIINLDKYRDLSLFIKRNHSSKNINPIKLLESEKKLLKSLQLAGSLTEKEALIVILSELFGNYKDYYTANLSSDGYLYLKSFGIKKYQKYFGENISDGNIEKLDKYYDLFLQYYETNINRDKIFTGFIEKEFPPVSKVKADTGKTRHYQDILEESQEINVVVCGGFHSAGLEREFSEKNVSYLVITPNVDGDYKSAGTIYENILLNSVDFSKNSIALQVLSQTGQSARFQLVIESMLSDELKRNPNLNIAEFLNDTVDKICAVDKSDIERAMGADYTYYKKPFNKGITANDDGTYTLNISFEGSSQVEKVIINGQTSYDSSIYGRRFAKTSPFWEWIYVMPFSTFIMASTWFKTFLGKTFLSKLSSEEINAGMRYNKKVKIVDSVISVLFIASFFINPVFFALSALIFIIYRAIIFTASHQNRFNVKNNNLQIKINLIVGIIYVLPFFLLSGALPWAFALNIMLHAVYNNWVSAIIASYSRNNYAYSDADLTRYFYAYEKKLLNKDLNKGFNIFSWKKIISLIHLFAMTTDKKTINEILPVLVRIAGILTERKKSGNVIVYINNVVASKLKYADKSVVEFIKKAENDYSNMFLFVLSNKQDRQALEKIIFTSSNIKLRLYAYALLRSNKDKWTIPSFMEKELLAGAKKLIRDFSWNKDFSHIDAAKWLYNGEFQSYIAAVYMIMASEHSEFTGKEDHTIYKEITEARFEAKYDNANASLSFGKDLFKSEEMQEIFPEIVAHELAHICLDKTGIKLLRLRGLLILLFFLPKEYKVYMQKVAIGELYADIAASVMSLSLGRDHVEYMNVMSKMYEAKTFSAFSEPHDAARKQFANFVNLLRENGLQMDLDVFAEVYKAEVMKNIKNNKVKFEELLFKTASEYLSRVGVILDYDDAASAQNGHISVHDLRDIFKPLVINVNNSALWEWVYMLPGVTYITRSKFFTGFLFNVIFKGKSNELRNEKIKRLRSNRFMRLFDIAGSAVFITSLLSGGGISSLLAYYFTRAVIFAYAHKQYDLRKNFKDKLKLAIVFITFSLPAICILVSGGFGINSIVLSLAIGIPSNFFLHNLYNKYKSKIKKLKNFPVAAILGHDGIGYSGGYERPYGANGDHKEHIEKLKAAIARRFNVLPKDIIVDIMVREDMLYSFEKITGRQSTSYVLEIDEYLMEFMAENEKFAAEFADNVEVETDAKDENKSEEFRNVTAFAVKQYFLISKRLRIPQLKDLSYIAEQMYDFGYDFSVINRGLLQYIAQNLNLSDDYKHKELIKLQVFELLGYILQSQTWLSPSGMNMQYGYLQKETMPDRYERQLANTDVFEIVFNSVFALHNYSHFVKSKEAALYEYFRKRGNITSSFAVPETLSGQFDVLKIADSKSKIYSVSGTENFKRALNDAPEGIPARYVIIDCSKTGDLGTIAEIINEYNRHVSADKSIKEVMFYNAKPDDYRLAMNDNDFESEFIFDISSFADAEQSDILTKMFTKVPAVYVTNDEVMLDYGSRIDNFSLQYLYMLFFRDESFRLQSKQKDSVRLKRFSVKPSDERIEETSRYYKDLISEFGKLDFFDGMKKFAVQAALMDASRCLKILNDKKSSASDLNYVIEEYRTLLNYLFYFKWSYVKDSGFAITGKEKSELALAYNSTMRKPADSSGKELSQETVIVTSGMSALATIGAFLNSEGIESIGFGNNIYYENIDMLREMNGGKMRKDAFLESDHEEILRLQRMGTKAVFVDLIANSVFMYENDTKDIEPADIKKIVGELSKREFSEPFYLCIDNSMYPTFQFADILDGVNLPDNFNIIIYGSMQKLHQRGLEISTAGFLTLISNGYRHAENILGLKEASVFTSSDIDDFRYIALYEFLLKNNNIEQRTERLNNNAREIALILNEAAVLLGGEFKVVHSSLYSGIQKRIWENNNMPQIPFLFIRDTRKRASMGDFMYKLLTNFEEEKFFDYAQRDSYGFNFFTNISYGANALRLNIGDHSSGQKDKIVRAVVKAFIFYSGNTAGAYKSIDSLYKLLSVHDIQNEKINDEVANGIVDFISLKHIINSMNYSEIFKAVTVCGRLNRPVPEILAENIRKALNNKSGIAFSDEENALLAEAIQYMPDISREQILEVSSQSWFSGKPKTEGAAAATLVEMITYKKTYSYNTADHIPSVLNKQSVADLLKAA
ncbi:MAG: hypothetical protein LBL00_02900 [Endomicrobium sp.]|nr:hypothetical protein [Endomicrobium sp.]